MYGQWYREDQLGLVPIGLFTCNLISQLLFHLAMSSLLVLCFELSGWRPSINTSEAELWILCGCQMFQVTIQRCQWSLLSGLERCRLDYDFVPRSNLSPPV
ncbi:hypothetical protein BDV06DRAFT_207789, partial [Aspergillus oleicola]